MATRREKQKHEGHRHGERPSKPVPREHAGEAEEKAPPPSADAARPDADEVPEREREAARDYADLVREGTDDAHETMGEAERGEVL